MGGAQSAPAQSLAAGKTSRVTKPSAADLRKAKSAFERGRQAEGALDWQTAFAAYTEAAGLIPNNPTYLMRREVLRFLLVLEHTDHAERAATAGNLPEARKQLEAALALDPSYTIARERLAQFQDAPPAPPASDQPRLASRPPEVHPQTGTCDFDFRGDVGVAYQEIARKFGVIAAFDPDLQPRPVRFRVSGVDFVTAMKLLGEETKTFWRALDARTFFVAQDTAAKRREYEPQITQHISLANAFSSDQMNETLRLVREIAAISHTELDISSKTMTLRDTPEKVALATELVKELQQAPGEVMLEIEILAVNSTLARSMGITPPSSARAIGLSPADVLKVQQATSPQQLLQLIQTLFGSTAVLSGGLGAVIPPLIAFGGGKSTYLATLPGARADFSDVFSVVKSGRRMLLRALDARPATFFVGERFPISMALLSTSLNPVGFTPTISSSQFPFLTAGAFPRNDFAVGAAPDAVVAGDFNGDAKPDLGVANQTDNAISLLIGLGNGAFQAQTTINAGNAPSALAAVDLNKDGKLDLVVANKASNTLSVLLGNGDGTFGTITDFATGANPLAIAAGDFNADGIPDLAVVNQGDNTVSVFLGKGDGTFSARLDTPTGNGPVAVAAADFNGDGKLDLVAANQLDSTISILLGNGDGTFFSKTDLPVAAGPSALAVADVDNDGHQDIVVTCATANSLTIFLGNGDGTFGSQVTLATGNEPSAVVAANFGLRGFIDLAVANLKDNTVSILAGNGDGTFLNRIDLPVGGSPNALATSDLTGSGRLDLMVTNQTSNSVSAILNSFFTSPQATAPQTAYPAPEYVDLGLKVSATPRIHPGREVTVQLKFEIRDLTGENFNGIPVISNRTIEQAVRLKENESAVLSGFIDREEARTLSGAPALAQIPGAGVLAGKRDTQKSDTELIIVITPRRVRLAPRLDRSIYAGKGGVIPAGIQ